MSRYRVTFLPAGRTVEVEPAADRPAGRGRPGSLLDVALAHGVVLPHECGGQGRCTTCHVVVRGGDANLSPLDEAEADRLDLAPCLTRGSRLACQAVVRGDVVVEVAG